MRFDTDRLRQISETALALCAGESGDGLFRLRELPVVEVAVVSDRVIAKLHQQFMDVPGATDVITFEHGEIVISADTARREARQQGHGVTEELALYVIHGMLHLNGHDDIKPRDRARMHRVQERIWKRVLAAVPATGKMSRAKRGGR